MRIQAVVVFSTLLFGISAAAQAPGPNPGVKPIRQIDRAEVRVTRVELAPGAIRSVHQHDDVRFHLFIPISGKIELTIGSAAPVEAVPGTAYFMEKSTPHGFRNLGNTPAMVMEVFVKDSTASAEGNQNRADAHRDVQALTGGTAAVITAAKAR